MTTSSSILKLPKVGLSKVNLFGSRKSSQTAILSKKIDIVTSPLVEEPQWDIVIDITDALNNDSGRAKRVLTHLRRIFEKSFQTSLDNQQLYNCLTVIDSFFRNGNENIIRVLHSQFLSVLSKLAKKAESDEKQKSLLQSNKKTCRDRVLNLIKKWATDERISEKKYPQFRAMYLKLRRDGLPFDECEQETTAAHSQSQSRNQSQPNSKSKSKHQSQAEEKANHVNQSNSNSNSNSSCNSTPWQQRHLTFGKWYKNKLKKDLFQLADQMILFQDILSMENSIDAQFLYQQLRESQKRLICIMLRCSDAGACHTFMQLVNIMATLLECGNKLGQGQRFQIPGVSKSGLHSLLNSLF